MQCIPSIDDVISHIMSWFQTMCPNFSRRLRAASWPAKWNMHQVRLLVGESTVQLYIQCKYNVQLAEISKGNLENSATKRQTKRMTMNDRRTHFVIQKSWHTLWNGSIDTRVSIWRYFVHPFWWSSKSKIKSCNYQARNGVGNNWENSTSQMLATSDWSYMCKA